MLTDFFELLGLLARVKYVKGNRKDMRITVTLCQRSNTSNSGESGIAINDACAKSKMFLNHLKTKNAIHSEAILQSTA
jgi:hypothetical protein